MERIAALRSRFGSVDRDTEFIGQASLPRAKIWRSQFPFADQDFFALRLAATQISGDEFLWAVSDQAVGHFAAPPPAWYVTFDALYSTSNTSRDRLPVRRYSSVQSPFSFLQGAEPIISHFVERLTAGAIALSREYETVPFDARDVYRMFIGGLLDTFQRMMTPTLILQLNLARLQNDLAGESSAARFEHFIDRLSDPAFAGQILSEYPVLARQLVRRAEQWLAASLLFLRHLSEDWSVIRSVFAKDCEPGTLAELQPHLGDSHRDGRSVMAATFSSGLRLVYKPRSLSVDLHFQRCLQWVNERLQNQSEDLPEKLVFRTLLVVDRGTHGWMEFVPSGDCSSEDGVRRFYERHGGYLALLYLLYGSDFHCENVIAGGEHPVLVDLEALFHTRLPSAATPRYGVAVQVWESSVLRSGLLPIAVRFGEGVPPLDRSGLGAAQAQMTPFALLFPEAGGTDEMRLTRKHLPIRPSSHRPTLQGRPVDQVDGDAIVRGFRTVYKVLLANRHSLLAADGPVACFHGDEVRIVLRHTLTYSRLLSESFHPDLLRDALDRDQMFDLLWGSVPESPHLSLILAAECRDLWNGDIPHFTARVGSRDIFASSGECIADFLPESNDQPVWRRAQSMTDVDLEKQVWIIRASLATLGAGGVKLTHALPRAALRQAAQGDRARLMAQACAVADRLEMLAVRSGDKAGWIGLNHEGKEDWSVKPLGPDLYDGTAGIVLFLAYLADITQQDRYRELALAGAANLKEQLLAANGWERRIGAFSGWGSLVYVFSHLATLWRRDDLLDDARLMVDGLPEMIDEDRIYDIIGGAAGCIASLLVLHALAPSAETMAMAIRCGDHLLLSACPTPSGLGWCGGLYEVPLGGFSHGASGIAWALLALWRLTGEPRFRHTALQALAYERSLFNPQQGNWADLRPLEARRLPNHAPMAAWCHGAAGVGLSRLRMLRDEKSHVLEDEITQAVETTLVSGFGNNHSLCHGDLGNLDFVLQAGEAIPGDAWTPRRLAVTRRMLDGVEHNGWKSGNGNQVEALGLMTGLAGIGYGMLRLAEPRRVPSVIGIAPPLPRTL